MLWVFKGCGYAIMGSDYAMVFKGCGYVMGI